MLRIENLNAYYDSIAALKGVSIEVPRGEIVSIIGANGAGKSTLLKAISGLIKTQQGRIVYIMTMISPVSRPIKLWPWAFPRYRKADRYSPI